MVADDALDGLLAFECLFLGSKQLDAYTFPNRIEIFIQKQFFHFLIDGAQLFDQYSSHDSFFLLAFNVLFPVVQNHSEGVFETSIQSLRL